MTFVEPLPKAPHCQYSIDCPCHLLNCYYGRSDRFRSAVILIQYKRIRREQPPSAPFREQSHTGRSGQLDLSGVHCRRAPHFGRPVASSKDVRWCNHCPINMLCIMVSDWSCLLDLDRMRIQTPICQVCEGFQKYLQELYLLLFSWLADWMKANMPLYRYSCRCSLGNLYFNIKSTISFFPFIQATCNGDQFSDVIDYFIIEVIFFFEMLTMPIENGMAC